MLNSGKNEFDLEQEMLQASYGSELEITTSPSGKVLQFHASPFVGRYTDQVFVSATAVINVPLAYPNEPAKFGFSESHGLDDKQIADVTRSLSKEAAEAARHGELYITVGIALICDFLTEQNKPNQCLVCLEAVKVEADRGEKMLLLKPCHHALHASCYGHYRKSLEERRKEKEALLLPREGPRKAARLARMNWAICLVCRGEFDVEAADKQLASSSLSGT